MTEVTDLLPHMIAHFRIGLPRGVNRTEHLSNEVANQFELTRSKATRRSSRRSQTHARCHCWFFRVKGHTVFIARNKGVL